MDFWKLHPDRLRRAAAPAVLAAFIIFCEATPSFGQVDLSSWMAQQQPVIQTIPLKGIAMPGSHDTFSYVVNSFIDYGKTQDLDIPGQLNAGIRHLDMRTYLLDSNGNIVGGGSCSNITNALPFSGAGYYMHAHGFCTGVRLENALDQISSYLDAHPQEIIVLRFSGTIQANSPDYNTSAAFEAVLDQHLRRGSDRASYIYDLATACRFAGPPWTSGVVPYPYFEDLPYAGICAAPGGGVPPQEVTPQQLYTTSARVIVIEEYGLTGCTATTGFGVCGEPPGRATLTWFSGSSEDLYGYYGHGAADSGVLNNWLAYSTPDGALGLYANRPTGVGYEHDPKLFTLQANLTPYGTLIGNYFLPPLISPAPLTLAETYNPSLAALLDSTWTEHSVNVVQVDYVDYCLNHPNPATCGDTVAKDITNFNSQTFGRVPFGLTGASQISVGHNGSVYKLGFTDGSGPSLFGQSHKVAKLTGNNGYVTDWTNLPISAARIAADPSGGVWALDVSGVNLTYVDASGKVIKTATSNNPIQDIAVSSDGTLWAIRIDGVPVQSTSTSLGGLVINWTPVPGTDGLVGINNSVRIAANNSVVAVLSSNGNIFVYSGNKQWGIVTFPFVPTSIAVDDNGSVWETQAPKAVGAYTGYTPLASTGLWVARSTGRQQFRTDGVQVATGYKSPGVDVVYVLDNVGNIHSLGFEMASGLGLQASPPRRYAATVSVSGLTFDHATQLFTGTLTVTNNTASPITDQLAVVYQGLPQGVTVANNPLTYQQLPFTLMPSVTLQPGDSVSTQVQFSDPNLVHINYQTEIFAYVAGS